MRGQVLAARTDHPFGTQLSQDCHTRSCRVIPKCEQEGRWPLRMFVISMAILCAASTGCVSTQHLSDGAARWKGELCNTVLACLNTFKAETVRL